MKPRQKLHYFRSAFGWEVDISESCLSFGQKRFSLQVKSISRYFYLGKYISYLVYHAKSVKEQSVLLRP